MNPKVSINLCCYNSEKYLRETLDSIVNQTYKCWELIIINDGSSDLTECIIDEYIKQGYPIIYHYQENKGLAYSRNEALKRSQGEYIAFIDHDDIWLSTKLEKQISVLGENDVALVYGNFFRFYPNKNKRIAFRCNQPSGDVFERFLYNFPVGLLTAVVTKRALDNLSGGLFDKNLNLSEDYDVFMRLVYKLKATYINEPLALYRVHQNMCSNKYKSKVPEEIKYVLEKLKRLYPEIKDKYPSAISYLNSYINLYYAKIELLKGNPKKARNILLANKLINHNSAIVYLVSYFHPKVFKFINNLRKQLSPRLICEYNE